MKIAHWNRLILINIPFVFIPHKIFEKVTLTNLPVVLADLSKDGPPRKQLYEK